MKINKSYAIITVVIFTIAAIKLSYFDRNEKFLNYFAQYYFDEEYYRKHYPEVKDQDLTPFDHYTKIGWKEDKNPRADFNTRFYKDLYLNYYPKYPQLNPLADFVLSKIRFEQRITNYDQLKKIDTLKNPKYHLSLAAIFQNEGRFLKEWIEFYRMIGVEHFYLYNHMSSDNYLEVLQPYIDKGIIELNHITVVPKNSKHWDKIQQSTYENAVNKSKKETEWLVIVDTDEFLFPIKEYKLSDFLKKYDLCAALSVNWQYFGSNNVEFIPEGELMIENLTKKYPYEDLRVKTIIRPRFVDSYRNSHFPNLKFKYAQCDENARYFKGPFIPEESRKKIRINHYYARDLKFFRDQKLLRIHIIEELKKDESNKMLDEINNLHSKKEDYTIKKYIPELKTRVFNQEILP